MKIAATCVAFTAVLAPGLARADNQIDFFGDVDYRFDRRESTTNSFQSSTLDIFATQTEGKFSFVGEIVAEAFGSNEFDIDVDGLEVTYKPRPWLRLRLGRIRSAFGYYGDAYQNGKFFMMPVSWPEMYEGDGFQGILPSEVIGLHVDATRDLGGDLGKLRVDAEVLNGRGRTLEEVPAFDDPNNGKAVNLRLRYAGGGKLDGLVVGGNAYIDQIPVDTTPGSEHAAMHELIVAAHAAYVTDTIQLVAEGAWIRHREFGTDTVHRTVAAFAEGGYAFGDFTPYVRYEYFHYGDTDPYFAAADIEVNDHQQPSVGVKYAASASVSLKLQGTVDFDPDITEYTGIAQAAFAF